MAVLSAKPGVAVRNIVVATDFSPASCLALDYAVAIARHYGSKIHLVHAIEAGSHAPEPHAGALWGREADAAAAERLRLEAEKCGEMGCAQWLLKGTALEVVERILSLDQVDLIVIGTHAGRGFRKAAIGSAAEHFFRNVHCPVLAVGPSVTESGTVWEPGQVLLATDLQSDEAVAAKCAVLLAREHAARLALLHVAAPAAAPYPEDQRVIARPYFESRLRELLSYKPHLDYPAEFLVEFGEDPVAEILRVSRQRSIDLIVLSVHREEPWGFHFVHEAYRIVAEAPCPVLITQRRL
ncbi:MAG TPA: universal stress protein [Candidatus Binatia bacterium]|nr:universal stress protein [Candidatus Binatia bacterium]